MAWWSESMPVPALDQPVTFGVWAGDIVVRPHGDVAMGTASPCQDPVWTDLEDDVVLAGPFERELLEQSRPSFVTGSTYVNVDTSLFKRRDIFDVSLGSPLNRPSAFGLGRVSGPVGFGIVHSSSDLVRSVRERLEALLDESLRSDVGVDFSVDLPARAYFIAEGGPDASSTVWTVVAASAAEGVEAVGSVEGDRVSVAQGLLTSQEYELREEIRSYTRLSDDWDGDGATAPCEQAVTDALAFLGSRPLGVPLPLPEVATTGDVGMYWDRGGVFAEVQFGGDGAFSYYAERRQGRTLVKEYGRDGLPVAGPWPDDMVRLLRQLKRS